MKEKLHLPKMTVRVLIAALLLWAPANAAQATLECALTVKEVYVYPRNGQLGARIELVNGGPQRVWLLCKTDTPDGDDPGVIEGPECVDLQLALRIAKETGNEMKIGFDDDVPDQNGQVALTCEEVDTWGPGLQGYIQYYISK